jgi:excisionase family DNA binding protein
MIETEKVPRPTRPLIKVEEAARLLGLSRSACYRAVAGGDLPSVRLGRRLFVPRALLAGILGPQNQEDD